KQLRENMRIVNESDATELINKNQNKNVSIYEPVARFLKSYAVFIEDHTGKEDIFFDLIDKKNKLSTEEDSQLLEHYKLCKKQASGEARTQEMLRLIQYLEEREWMKENYS